MNAPAVASPGPGWARWWPALAVIGLVLLAFRETGWAMVSVWMRSDTFAHAFLVPPISAWLAWRRRDALAGLPLQPQPMLLGAIAATCLAWLVADVASVNAATQLALVTLVVLTVPALAGWRIARVLAFPLLFLYFAVPIGEFMLPWMMNWTADFTVAAVRLSGVPVYREGLQFVIPSGSWSVVEACSGVRYLIASFMVGTLFAYLNYSSTRRRLLFVLASIAVPVVANWLRAYMIVMLGHLSGNELAVGTDHLIYGWVFFGVVIGLMFMIGARWTEPLPAAAATDASAPPTSPQPGGSRRGWVVAGGIAAIVAVTLLAQAQLRLPAGGAAPSLSLPAPVAGWEPAPQRLSDWVPSFRGASAQAHVAYLRQGVPVGLWLGYYRDQSHQRQVVASVNSLVHSDSVTWTQVEASLQDKALASDQPPLSVLAATLRDTPDPNVRARLRLRVWQWYWINGEFTASPVRAKLLLAWQRLRGAGDDSAALIVYTPWTEDSTADGVLTEFVRTQLPGLRAALEGVAARR